MAVGQRQMSNDMLTELLQVMRLTMMDDLEEEEGDFSPEGCCDSLESDGPTPVSSDDKAVHDAAHRLRFLGDVFSKEKEDAALVDDIVQYLRIKAETVDESLGDALCSQKDIETVLKGSMINAFYDGVKSRLLTFLVGQEGVKKIAIVNHVARGVADALKDSWAPARDVLSIISSRFVIEECADVLTANNGIGSLVRANS